MRRQRRCAPLRPVAARCEPAAKQAADKPRKTVQDTLAGLDALLGIEEEVEEEVRAHPTPWLTISAYNPTTARCILARVCYRGSRN